MYKPLLFSVLYFLASFQLLAELVITIKDKQDDALTNVVVELQAKESSAEQHSVVSTERNAETSTATMKQLNQQFVPHILAIHKGAVVTFPDTDTVRHHVYSFSKAKTFEVLIYKEEIERKIVFDQAGIVELGCNIHDWMLGYLYVAESPLFKQTNEKGEVSFGGLTEGQYTVKIWHPRIDRKDLLSEHSVNVTREPTLHTINLREPILPSLNEFDSVNGLQGYE